MQGSRRNTHSEWEIKATTAAAAVKPRGAFSDDELDRRKKEIQQGPIQPKPIQKPIQPKPVQPKYVPGTKPVILPLVNIREITDEEYRKHKTKWPSTPNMHKSAIIDKLILSVTAHKDFRELLKGSRPTTPTPQDPTAQGGQTRGMKSILRKPGKPPPPVPDHKMDKPSAFSVLLAVSVIKFMYFGMLSCYGIFFVYIREQYGARHHIVPWVGFLQSTCYVASMILVLDQEELQERIPVFIGGVVMSYFLAFTPAVPTVVWSMVSLGLMSGIGGGMVYPTACCAMQKFYHESRDFANAATCLFASLGCIIWPQLMSIIIATSAYPVGMCVLGGWIAVIAISAVGIPYVKDTDAQAARYHFYKDKLTGLVNRNNQNLKIQDMNSRLPTVNDNNQALSRSTLTSTAAAQTFEVERLPESTRFTVLKSPTLAKARKSRDYSFYTALRSRSSELLEGSYWSGSLQHTCSAKAGSRLSLPVDYTAIDLFQIPVIQDRWSPRSLNLSEGKKSSDDDSTNSAEVINNSTVECGKTKARKYDAIIFDEQDPRNSADVTDISDACKTKAGNDDVSNKRTDVDSEVDTVDVSTKSTDADKRTDVDSEADTVDVSTKSTDADNNNNAGPTNKPASPSPAKAPAGPAANATVPVEPAKPKEDAGKQASPAKGAAQEAPLPASDLPKPSDIVVPAKAPADQAGSKMTVTGETGKLNVNEGLQTAGTAVSRKISDGVDFKTSPGSGKQLVVRSSSVDMGRHYVYSVDPDKVEAPTSPVLEPVLEEPPNEELLYNRDPKPTHGFTRMYWLIAMQTVIDSVMLPKKTGLTQDQHTNLFIAVSAALPEQTLEDLQDRQLDPHDSIAEMRESSTIPMKVLMAVQCLGYQGVWLTYSFLPSLAEEHGVTPQNQANLVTFMAIMELAGRFGFGFMSYTKVKKLKPSELVAMTFACQAFLYVLIPFFTSFGALLAFCLFRGLQGGAFLGVMPAVIVELVGREQFRKTYGEAQLVNGLMLGLGYLFIGYLRLWTESYVAGLQYLGATCLISAALLLAMPKFFKMQKKKDEKLAKKLEKYVQALKGGEILPGSAWKRRLQMNRQKLFSDGQGGGIKASLLAFTPSRLFGKMGGKTASKDDNKPTDENKPKDENKPQDANKP